MSNQAHTNAMEANVKAVGQPGIAASLIIGASIMISFPAIGQTLPSQIKPLATPKPPWPLKVDELHRLEPGQNAPEGSELMSVAIGSYLIESDSDRLRQIARQQPLPEVGRRVSVAELYALARQLESALVAAGYPLARVLIPAQTLVDGGAGRFVIVDGFIENVEVRGLPERIQSQVAQVLSRLVIRRELTQRQLEDSLLQAAGLPGLRLQSALERGFQPGGARLIVEGQYAPDFFGVDIDNKLGRSLGRWQLGATWALNNRFGMGERILFGSRSALPLAIATDAPARMRLLMLNGSVPVDEFGTLLGAEIIDSRTFPSTEPNAPKVSNVYQRATVRMAKHWLRSRATIISGEFSLDTIDQQSQATDFGLLLNHDHYRALRMSLSAFQMLPGIGQLEANLNWSGGLGGREIDDVTQSGVPLSRQGASPHFRRLNATIRVEWLVRAWGVSVQAGVQAQDSLAGVLPQAEQMSVEGPLGLSGSPAGGTNVDSGYAGRVELRLHRVPSFSTPASGSVTPFIHAGAGRGSIMNPTALESEQARVKATGLGLRWGASTGRATHSAAFEWSRSWQAGNIRGAPSVSDSAVLSYSLQFQ